MNYLDLADRSWPLLRRLMGVHTFLYERSGGRVGHRVPGVGAPVRAVALPGSPGPQLGNRVPLTRRLKERYPPMPVVWGEEKVRPTLFDASASRRPGFR